MAEEVTQREKGERVAAMLKRCKEDPVYEARLLEKIMEKGGFPCPPKRLSRKQMAAVRKDLKARKKREGKK